MTARPTPLQHLRSKTTQHQQSPVRLLCPANPPLSLPLPHTHINLAATQTHYTEQTKFPTLSYGLAEGKGDLLSTSDGIWGNAEFGYNPLNNNLAASASTGTAHSANTGGSDRIGEAGPGACGKQASGGLAGVQGTVAAGPALGHVGEKEAGVMLSRQPI